MLGEDLQDLVGIQRIALGAAGFEGFAELGHRERMEWVKDQEVIALQGMDQAPARLLDGHCDGPAAKAVAQLGHPRADEFGFLFQGAGFLFGLASRLQTEDVLLIGPIDGDEGRVVVGRIGV